MIVSTTKFTLKSWRLYIPFFVDTYNVVKQVRRAGGIVHMKIGPISLRTITVWKREEDMRAFRNSGAHLHAMKKSRSYGAIVSTVWESDSIPTWREAIQKLDELDDV